MRVLTVPNWSFGRDRALLREFRDALESRDVTIHFLESDLDHNRTVSAFSGSSAEVKAVLLELCDLAFPRIDLNRHIGVHPRIGALDVCPFLPLESLDSPSKAAEFGAWIDSVCISMSEAYELPIFLYEKSERGRHEALLPALRSGGFGRLIEQELEPDFGPDRAHKLLGATVVGWREWLIAMNVNLARAEPDVSREIAQRVRQLREAGDERFLGVRALGLPLASREISQVSMNVTLPDLTPVDPVIEWVIREAAIRDTAYAQAELIGVIRSKDVPTATRLPIRPEQIIEV